MAERIQRRRTKGWRMPEGAVYVGRPSRWGNPFVMFSRMQAVAVFRPFATDLAKVGWFEPLRGRDLACWCPLDQPCHADVLLELANA